MPWTQLHVAAETGDEELAAKAIEQGVNVNDKDDGEQTPLHRAAGFGHAALVSFLIKSNASINARDESGSTPLHLSAWKGQVAAAEALLDNNADIDARGLYGDSPLHLASSYGQLKTAEMLLSRDADKNAKDNAGKTPMDWAKEAHQTQLITLLVKRGGMASVPVLAQVQNKPAEEETLMKILVVGDTGTGKTSFIKRYVSNIFTSKYKATIGVDFALKSINVGQKIARVQLWDIAGQERFGAMTHVYYKQALGALVMFDTTRPATFESAAQWKADIDEKVQLSDGSPIPVILVGTKSDLTEARATLEDEALADFARTNNYLAAVTCSSKSGDNVVEVVEIMATAVLEQGDSNESVGGQAGGLTLRKEEETKCCDF